MSRATRLSDEEVRVMLRALSDPRADGQGTHDETVAATLAYLAAVERCDDGYRDLLDARAEVRALRAGRDRLRDWFARVRRDVTAMRNRREADALANENAGTYGVAVGLRRAVAAYDAVLALLPDDAAIEMEIEATKPTTPKEDA